MFPVPVCILSFTWEGSGGGGGGEETPESAASGQFLLITLCLDNYILIEIYVYHSIKAIT